MDKEMISSKQAISMIALFAIGSSVVVGGNSEAMQDSWISLIAGFLLALPMVLIYARLVEHYPGKDIFDITLELFGNIAGKIVIALFTWYALHLGGLVFRNFSEFIQVAAMVDTPQFAILAMMCALCIYVAKSGLITFGKLCLILTPVFLFIVLFTILLGFKDYHYQNILPVFGEFAWKIPIGAFSNFSFPFAETVLMIAVFSSLGPKHSPYKIYTWGISIAALTIIAGIVRNILLLGAPMYSATYYPSYNAVKLIIVGQFFSRIEGLVSANFLISGFVKVSICLIAAAKGMTKLFNVKDFKSMVVPAALIMISIASIVYKNTMEMYEWFGVYKYYAFPFQVIFPIALLIVCKWKKKKKENQLA